MSTFHWEQDSITELDGLDEEQLDFFRRIDDMFLSMRDRRAGAESDALLFLRQYVRRHFRQEEGLMRSADYPCLDAHVQDHARILLLVENVCEAVENADALDTDILAVTNRMLANLVVQHVHRFDMAFAQHRTAAEPTEAPGTLAVDGGDGQGT